MLLLKCEVIQTANLATRKRPSLLYTHDVYFPPALSRDMNCVIKKCAIKMHVTWDHYGYGKKKKIT